jgi:hypothetical protein
MDQMNKNIIFNNVNDLRRDSLSHRICDHLWNLIKVFLIWAQNQIWMHFKTLEKHLGVVQLVRTQKKSSLRPSPPPVFIFEHAYA